MPEGRPDLVFRRPELVARIPDETYAQQREGTRVRIGQGKATQPRPVPAEEIRWPTSPRGS
ncbi:MAG: hypothetical protein VX516_03505 [Actinomycetota bacterium]|jgi:hypothetical protein|nr:hypothetical protein [Actinomycetota bacterium]|tara:strand:+ start:28 stop:210 length:183 start_codon:yes stop_codon:yes gene_type:complete